MCTEKPPNFNCAIFVLQNSVYKWSLVRTVAYISSDVTKEGLWGVLHLPPLLEMSIGLVGILAKFLPYRRNFDVKTLFLSEILIEYTHICRNFDQFRRNTALSEITPPHSSRSSDVTAPPPPPKLRRRKKPTAPFG